MIVTSGCSTVEKMLLDRVSDELNNDYTNESGIVTRVIDGDTVEIFFDSGVTDKVRLVGIDCPETNAKSDSDDWYNMSDTELKPYGYEATNYINETLLNKRVTIQYDRIAGKVDVYKRRLGYIIYNGKNINIVLVERGLARVYIEGNSELKYVMMQQQLYAMDNCIGVWELKCQN